MDGWVINLDSELERWHTTADRLRAVGVVPYRWSATPDTGQQVGEWHGRWVPDVSRRQAITDSYQRLLAHLDGTDQDEWLIFQDDNEIRVPPNPPESSLIHIFGGWRVLTMARNYRGLWRPVPDSWHLADTTAEPHHVCPQAFYLHRRLLSDLRRCWSDTTRKVCETWTPLLHRYATYEDEPTIEAILSAEPS